MSDLSTHIATAAAKLFETFTYMTTFISKYPIVARILRILTPTIALRYCLRAIFTR